MSTAKELKPCPFCGKPPALEDHRTIWVVRCECGVSMLGERAPEPEEEMPAEYWDRFEQSAIDAWNKRVSLAPAEQAAGVNQCDGCAQGAPISGGLHRDKDGRAFMTCQAHKYASPQPPATHKGAWKDIETAPRDGTPILLWEQWSYNPFVGWWDEDFKRWHVSTEHVSAKADGAHAIVVSYLTGELTHWMPLPQPPGIPKESEHG